MADPKNTSSEKRSKSNLEIRQNPGLKLQSISWQQHE